jgi:hypothetical protein
MSTDWTAYYRRPYKTAKLSRSVMASVLKRRLTPLFAGVGETTVIELGGANSAFYSVVAPAVSARRYTVIDNNVEGLRLFAQAHSADPRSRVIKADVTESIEVEPADLCVSFGLVEHFDPDTTRRVIERHFSVTRPGGFVLITFPTPTWLYRLVRYAAEISNTWIFHDERPMRLAEVLQATAGIGKLTSAEIVWGTVLTQMVTLFQKPLSDYHVESEQMGRIASDT